MGGGFTSLALTGMLAKDGFLKQQALAADGQTDWQSPMQPRMAHQVAKAKHVIFLFMYGGPSHMDTFDYKPELYPLDGKTIDVKTFGRGGHKNQGRVVGPKWGFKPYGQTGKMVSDLFPNVAQHVDDIAFIHSMTADSPIHGSAMLMMNSPLVRDVAERVARRIMNSDADDGRRINRLYLTLLARTPKSSEVAIALDFIRSYQAKLEMPNEESAWTALSHAVLAGNEFVYLR